MDYLKLLGSEFYHFRTLFWFIFPLKLSFGRDLFFFFSPLKDPPLSIPVDFFGGPQLFCHSGWPPFLPPSQQKWLLCWLNLLLQNFQEPLSTLSSHLLSRGVAQHQSAQPSPGSFAEWKKKCEQEQGVKKKKSKHLDQSSRQEDKQKTGLSSPVGVCSYKHAYDHIGHLCCLF